MKKNIILTENIKEILEKVPKTKKIYVVGGYIRDSLLKIIPKDCDFTTNLSLVEMLSIFSEYEIRIISEKLEIIELKIEQDRFEIARMREDKKYYNNRKNFDFNFVDDIYLDLKRRDFTVNSFAYNGNELFYLDEKYLKDIKNKNLKFIGNTKIRIEEDPLRILRLFRIFSEKSFVSINENDLKIISEHKNLIFSLSKEMIQKELISIIKGDNYLNAFKYINNINLLDENFYIGNFYNAYNDRLCSLFKFSDLTLLKKLDFSKKILKKIEMSRNFI